MGEPGSKPVVILFVRIGMSKNRTKWIFKIIWYGLVQFSLTGKTNKISRTILKIWWEPPNTGLILNFWDIITHGFYPSMCTRQMLLKICRSQVVGEWPSCIHSVRSLLFSKRIFMIKDDCQLHYKFSPTAFHLPLSPLRVLFSILWHKEFMDLSTM